MTKIIVRRDCPACAGKGHINRHLGCHRCQGAAMEDAPMDLKDTPEVRYLSGRVEHMENGIQELLHAIREHTNQGKLQTTMEDLS